MHVPFRIPVPVHDNNRGNGLDVLTLRQEYDELSSRGPGGEDGIDSTLIVIIVLVVGILVVSCGGFMILRRRAERRRVQGPGNLEPLTQATSSGGGMRRGGSGSGSAVSETNRDSTASNLNRNTSIHSVMTLPKYSNTVNEGERVLGRAGERDGVDIIIEMPSDEQQEALRNEEMETMYQIRLTRRQQAEERDERRRRTREARERGDRAALQEIQQIRTAQNNDTTIQDLRERQSEIRASRDRATSSVGYHGLGIVHNNGTRIRANSTESERIGLLSDAASIALSTRPVSAMSGRRPSDVGGIAVDTRSPSPHSHHRMRSVSSVLSLDNNGEISPRSGAVTPQQPGGGYHNVSRAGSSPEILSEADLGDSDMPPPDYEDVSLDDLRSGATTPMFHGPPPDYATHDHINDEDGSGDLASRVSNDNGSGHPSNRSSSGLGGPPRLPSLRIGGMPLGDVPQIVIEPSTAHPSETGR